ncbi:FAD-dependent oxidoreductase [Mycobacteroides abscessus]|uniref:FAD-dependent oxidoreductase n=1 Tax=Mycobacteroides abscessus TaxID=36809 RepID=UPI000925DE78|nr:FAD-dependent oxidoreductase [Mycobacteroides abscessus]SHU87377.1 NADPH-dependent glutamate synthase beta chain-like oxidoreductase [Mycobacteroides abscessus subsp. bolletii]SHW22390.1 NADPH-dependent glutamate synthase beta chain-like oxidoreductase [Mycobacteroides abscessus subsp. bolletii]SHW47037.1 NADPH-dependent glutamate synthase beta chain-like oxidoreductase [Mycobacteroides abscessus subsp. bolletii]SHX91555.1 NADPH-dependent glutamate synthase beta chain-like oxidoreductase [My
MTHLITRACCNDASCVAVCPVNCIHPTPSEPEFGTAEMLYIDPATCIDCGQCIDECPVSAIVRDDEMSPHDWPYLTINADYYRDHDVRTGAYMRWRAALPALSSRLRVAIVGAGPAGFFVAERLLEHQNAAVDMFDRLPTPYGLVRAGVAPDHQDTKNVQRLFEKVAQREEFRYILNVDVGHDITHDELARYYHAVVYTTGASADRKLGIPGEDLPNSLSAREVVAWYNGHPDQADVPIDLSVHHAVVIGNGNVALDVARILTLGPDELRRSDIPADVLEALHESKIREVTILARRDIAHAAYSTPEFLSLTQLRDVGIEIDRNNLGVPPDTRQAFDDGTLDSTIAAKIRFAHDVAVRRRSPRPARTIRLRFHATPQEIFGGKSGCAGVRVLPSHYGPGGQLIFGDTETIAAGLVIRAAGYRGKPIPDLPFDDHLAVIPNQAGAVTGSPGTYVAGWIKRGPQGGIGRNRMCSLETANTLLADFEHATLPEPTGAPDGALTLLRQRGVPVVDASGWQRIDAAETVRGQLRGAPREKFIDIRDMLAVAHSPSGAEGTPA